MVKGTRKCRDCKLRFPLKCFESIFPGFDKLSFWCSACQAAHYPPSQCPQCHQMRAYHEFFSVNVDGKRYRAGMNALRRGRCQDCQRIPKGKRRQRPSLPAMDLQHYLVQLDPVSRALTRPLSALRVHAERD